ncbi:Methionine synthase [Nymphon striatum]|nr:Methionine synthase [Nymphon striatum]
MLYSRNKNDLRGFQQRNSQSYPVISSCNLSVAIQENDAGKVRRSLNDKKINMDDLIQTDAAINPDILETNTFNATRVSMADYEMEDLAYELNKENKKDLEWRTWPVGKRLEHALVKGIDAFSCSSKSLMRNGYKLKQWLDSSLQIVPIQIVLNCTQMNLAKRRSHWNEDYRIICHVFNLFHILSGEYVRHHFFNQVKKPFIPTDKRKKMLVIGDSHAQDFYNAMLENNLTQRYQISTRRIPAICGLYLGSEDITPLIVKKHIPICQKADTLAEAMPQINQADVVIIAANWKLWSAQRLSTTIQNLQIKTPQKLFVVGRKDFGKVNLRKYLQLSDNELRTLRNPVYGLQREINQTIKQKVPERMFVDIQALICKSENDCPLFTPQPRLISFDGGHLTKDGARYVGSILLQNPPLNQL